MVLALRRTGDDTSVIYIQPLTTVTLSAVSCQIGQWPRVLPFLLFICYNEEQVIAKCTPCNFYEIIMSIVISSTHMLVTTVDTLCTVQPNYLLTLSASSPKIPCTLCEILVLETEVDFDNATHPPIDNTITLAFIIFYRTSGGFLLRGS